MKKKNISGIMYSTNPDFEFQEETQEIVETLLPEKQKLRISLDKKDRAGKQVTLVNGFVGSPDDLLSLSKSLKNHCGSGGSVNGNEILLQGDFRDKILNYLIQKGYGAKKI